MTSHESVRELCERVVALTESVQPTVEGFLFYATGAVTQQDAADSKRSRYNPNALSMYLGKLQAIEGRLRRRLKSSDEKDLRDLIAELTDGFNLSYMPGIKKTIRAIEAYIATGKAPKYPGSSAKPRA